MVFLPDPEKGNRGNRASAYTDEQGRYKLRSERDRKDGTVLGPHRVVILDITSFPEPPGSGEMPGQPPSPGKAPRVPEDYSEAARTPFKDVEVRPEADPQLQRPDEAVLTGVTPEEADTRNRDPQRRDLLQPPPAAGERASSAAT